MFGLLMLVLFILLVYGLIKIGIEAIYLLAFLGFLYAIKDVIIGVFSGLLPIFKVFGVVVIGILLLTFISVIIDLIKGKSWDEIWNSPSITSAPAETKKEELEETVDADSFGRFE